MGESIYKQSCPKCGSSKGLQVFRNDSGQTDGYCFACTTFQRVNDEDTKPAYTKEHRMNKDDVLLFPYRGDSDRKVSKEVNARYGVRVSVSETTGEVNTVYYPYYIENVLAGFKVRILPKEFSGAVGSTKGCDMFGQHLCDPSKNKTILITEGEEDAIAIADVLYKLSGKTKWADVVSLKDGATIGKNFDKELKFLNQYSRIIAVFDNDKPGQGALDSLSLVVDGSKLFTLKLSEKDPSSCVKNGRSKEISDGFMNPTPYRPAYVKSMSELKDSFFAPIEETMTKYPADWKIMNSRLEGMCLSSLDTFCAGSGLGKSAIFKELAHHIYFTTNHSIGMIFLEESTKRTLESLISFNVKKRIQVPSIRASVPIEDLQKAWSFYTQNDRFVFHDHAFGSMTDDAILSSIKYMATVMGCKYIFVDHLGMIVAQSETGGDVNSRVETLMSKLRALVQSLNIWLGLVVHLRKTSYGSTPFEKGAIPTEDDMKGASGIKQYSDSVIAMQRNSKHSDDHMRHITALHVLKNRLTGDCGEADYLEYNPNSGRMIACMKPMTPILEKSRDQILDDFGA